MKARATLVLATAFCWLGAAVAVSAEEPAPGKTGTYTATFVRRSPLSDPKELAPRLSQKKLDHDYDLAKEPFTVHVPDSYDPAKPVGMNVLINYKDTPEVPEAVLPILKDKNLALVVFQHNGQEWSVRCGLALDVVYNMESLYAVDPARVYVFGFDLDADAIRLGLGFPDVFAGFLVTQPQMWKPMRTSRNTTFEAKLPPPPAKYLALAHARPAVLCRLEDREYDQLVTKTFQADGFRSVLPMKITPVDIHYPHLTTEWFASAVQFLDGHAADPKPALTTRPAAPATRPAATQPAGPSGGGLKKFLRP